MTTPRQPRAAPVKASEMSLADLMEAFGKALKGVEGASATRVPRRKLCGMNRHLQLADSEICHGCWMEFEAEDRRAKDLEAGRTGNEPDGGEDAEG